MHDAPGHDPVADVQVECDEVLPVLGVEVGHPSPAIGRIARMNEIAIRVAAPGDEAVLAGIAAVVQQLHFAERPDVFKPVNVEALRYWFRAALQMKERHILLAEVLGTAVGYAAVVDGERHEDAFALPRTWREVDQLAVVPAHRKQGVARALVEHIAAAALAGGVPALELNTWAFNQAARDTFQRLGFIEKSLRYERLLAASAPEVPQ